MRDITPPVLMSAVFLAACAAPAPSAPPVGLVPDAGGLQPNGTTLRIDFGRAETGVVAAVSRLVGAGPAVRRSVPGCGDLAVWPDGLGLVFVEGTFRGWRRDASAAGVTCR